MRSSILIHFKDHYIRDHIAQKVILQRPFQSWVTNLKFHGYHKNLPGEKEWMKRCSGGEIGGGGGGRVPVSIGAPQAVGSKRTRDDSSSGSGGSGSSEVKIKKEKIR